MPQDILNEREFELINIVGAQMGSNQRDLSRHLDLSLGQTNMLIRRLVAKGFIRINQLNKRKMQYILTPKGFTEKMRKSIKYTLNTINSIGLIRKCLREILSELHEQGEKIFYILGESDLAGLVEMTFKEISFTDYSITHIKTPSETKPDGVLFICKEGFEKCEHNAKKRVNLLQELAQNADFATL